MELARYSLASKWASEGSTEQLANVILNRGVPVDTRDTESGATLLHVAAVNGHTKTVLLLLRLGACTSVENGTKGTPLHQAALHGHVSTVKAMLEAGCPVDVVDSDGRSVLHAAAAGGNAEVVREVLSTGCDMNAAGIDGRTPLHVAARKGNTEASLELIRHGAEKAIVAGAAGTPLHQAARGGHVSTVKAMLEVGCPVHVVDGGGSSVLHAAAAGGNAEVVRAVLSTGCDMNAAANDGRTPLHVAAVMGNTEAALELIRHGAEKAIVAGAAGTPLHQAAVGGHVSTVKAMLEAGCPVDVVDSDGWSVLHDAAAGGNAEVVGAVLSTGCDMNAADNDGRTPLRVAAVMGNTEAALELIRHGAEKAIVAGAAGTPLHHAAWCGHVSTVKAMLEAGCPVDVVDSDGWSVLHAAAVGGNAEMVREVLSTGCDMNAADNDGATPLHVGAVEGNTEAVMELIRRGASTEVSMNGFTPLHDAVTSDNEECVRALLEHGADPWKVAPFIGSAYNWAFQSGVEEAFIDYIVEEEDGSLPQLQEVFRDHEWFHWQRLDRRSALVRDGFGISFLEYAFIVGISDINAHGRDKLVLQILKLSFTNVDNLLLLAAILGLNTFLEELASIPTDIATFHPYFKFAAQTVTSLVRMQYSSESLVHLQKLVPPDASLNLLHVALLAMKEKTSRKLFVEIRGDDYPSLLKFLVTNGSFRHTLHEYLPNGLTPLDLAEKLGLEEAVTIISTAGGRHSICTMISEEVKLKFGRTVLLAHQELMKLASSGPLGQQGLQAVLSQLWGKSLTVEQGTVTEESHLHRQKVLEQRPDLTIIVKAVLPNCENWEETGIMLQVPTSTLNDLEHSQYRLRDKYRKVLQHWLDHNEAASWRALLEVLGHFETKDTIDRLTQDILAAQDSEVQATPTTEGSPYPAVIGATPPPPSSQLPPQFVSHVVHHVGVNWYDFALYLGISTTVLEVVREEQRGLTSGCCRESLHRWLRHDRDTGGKGREVGVVLEAVRKASGPVAVELIQSSLHGGEVRPASPTPLLQRTPELASLQEHVVPFVAAQWEAVADYLLVSYEKRAVIAASERGRVEVCCRELFNQWLQQLPGTGSLSRTWGTVLDVVQEAVGLEVAKQIRARLDSKEGAVPPLPAPCGSTTGPAALPQQDTLTVSATAEASVSGLKRPPAVEGASSTKRRDVGEGASPEETAEASTSGRKRPPADEGTSSAKRRYSI